MHAPPSPQPGRFALPRWIGAGASTRALVLLLAMNLIPLLGLLSAVQVSSAGTVSGYSLLPVLVVPTAIITAVWGRRWYLIQLTLAAVVGFAVIGAGPHSVSARLVGAIATVGTLIFVTLVVADGKRRVDIDIDVARLRAASSMDALTGALNRRGLEQAVPGLLDRAATLGLPVGVAAIDLDHFKRINDDAGHEVGDAVLAKVTAVARETVADRGVVARTGGEEFIVIVVGDITAVMDAVRQRLARAIEHPAVTISVGTISADPTEIGDVDGLWDAIEHADQWLYQAKAEGRNRTVDGGAWSRDAPVADRLPAPALAASAAPDLAPAGSERSAMTVRVRRDGAAPRSGTAPSRRRWQLPAPLREVAARSRDQWVDRRSRRLYQAIVSWMVMVGVVATVQQVLADGGGLAATAGLFAVGAVVGGAAILWLRRVRTAWQFLPLAIIGSPFELIAVLTLPPEGRTPALMLVLLAALLVVTHWPGGFASVQVVIVAIGAFGAAMFEPRPIPWQLAIAALTAGPLIYATQLVGRLRFHQQAAEDELRELALIDPLTGLGNRRALDRAAQQWRSGQLVMLDIDHFKALNDRYGHAVGDTVLVGLAETLTRLATHPRSAGIVYRIGGDEFVIAGPDLDARAILGLLSGALPGLPVTVQVSGGSGSWPGPDGDDLWAALAAADRRMLRRKRLR